MALQRTRLTPVMVVPASVDTIYENSAATRTHVRGVTFINRALTTQVVKLWWVPDGDSPDDTNIIQPGLQLQANEVFTWDIPYSITMLDDGETLQAEADAADSINIIIHGDKDQ